MKFKKILILISILFSFSSFGKASSGSSGVGNGGDPVRDAFILLGKNILKNYSQGFSAIQDKLSKQGINDYKELESFLTIEVIHTTKEPLIDNQGSLVSAIGEPGSITLYVGKDSPAMSWENILLNTFKSERLVLHEMLRAASVNDDNFIITNIVLKDQGRVTGGKLNFVWSMDNDALISSALSNSFNSRTQLGELNSFRKSSRLILERNATTSSELVKYYLIFLTDLDSKDVIEGQGLDEILRSYRETFRNLKLVNLNVDQLALHISNADKNRNAELAQYFILNLRQIQAKMMQFKDIDKKSLENYIHSLILISMTNEYSSDSFSMLTSTLTELETAVKNESKNEKILEKSGQIVKMLQSLNLR